MEISSSKNVTFKLENDNLNISSNSKRLTLSDLPKEKKRRNSKITSSSIEKTKTRYSKTRLSRPSIFSNNNRVNNNLFIRFDAYGNEIVKGSKNHKVSFIDNISRQKIAEVILVENDYNLHHYPIDKIDENENEKNGCQCDNCCLIY